jgi:hypothetical protein
VLDLLPHRRHDFFVLQLFGGFLHLAVVGHLLRQMDQLVAGGHR